MDLFFISSVFFTLFFVVDPVGLIPVFISYLSGFSFREKSKIIIKATLLSIGVSLFFITLGKYLLRFLGISSGAFLVAGGILLFLIAIEMLFGKASRIKMRYYQKDESVEGDVSVFPLAIPMLCGPGNIAALLMFSSGIDDDPLKLCMLGVLSVVVFCIAMLVMFLSTTISKLLGNTGVSISQRLVGLILSAMAVQFIKNGLVVMHIIRAT